MDEEKAEDLDTLHIVAYMGLMRLMEALLHRPGPSLFVRGFGGHTITCMAALSCKAAVMRACLEAHRERSTLREALEAKCGNSGEVPVEKTLLHHVVYNDCEWGITPEALATADSW